MITRTGTRLPRCKYSRTAYELKQMYLIFVIIIRNFCFCRLDQVYQKVHRTINAFEYFTTNEWNYRGDHMSKLETAVNEAYRAAKNRGPNECVQDKIRLLSHLLEPEEVDASEVMFPKLAHPFTISPGHLEWLDYFEIYILGIRKYLCNEPPSTIPEARRQLYL